MSSANQSPQTNLWRNVERERFVHHDLDDFGRGEGGDDVADDDARVLL